MQHEHTIFRSIAEHEAYNIQIKSRAAEHEAYYIQSKSRARRADNTTRVHAWELAFGRPETERRQGTYQAEAQTRGGRTSAVRMDLRTATRSGRTGEVRMDLRMATGTRSREEAGSVQAQADDRRSTEAGEQLQTADECRSG